MEPCSYHCALPRAWEIPTADAGHSESAWQEVPSPSTCSTPVALSYEARWEGHGKIWGIGLCLFAVRIH